MKYLTLLLGLVLSVSTAFSQRIVVLSPDVADVVVALGHAKDVVGRHIIDSNPELKNVTVVGMHRSIVPDTVMSVEPDLVLGSWMVKPASIFERLQQVGVKAVNVAPTDDLAAYANSIREIGKLIGETDKANLMADKWLADMQKHSSKQSTGKRFILSYDGRIVAGKNSVPNKLIELAGGINAVGEIEGLKPLSREGWLNANPDVVIIAIHHSKALGGVEGVAKRVELKDSNAVKQHKVFFWNANDYFRYGLNTPEVVQKLHDLAQ